MFSESALAAWDPAPFRTALKRAGYTAARLEELGLKSLTDPFARVAVVSRTFPQDSPIVIVSRLFDAGEPVSGLHALALFGQDLEGLMRLGLIEPLGNDLIRSVARLEADGDGWFACDHMAALASGKTDYTMGIGMSTRLLGALMPVRSGDRVLDLCTGGGWVALHQAAAGGEVTASDLNERAIGFARFNARLAGGRPVEFLTGNLFEPVEGRRFDVITCNPPFVLSPGSTFIYRDSGCRGDSLCEQLARRIPDFLLPGGIGVLLLNWHDDGRDESSQRPLSWLEGSGCGAWLFRGLSHGPAEYAQRWLRESGRGRTPDAAEMDRWMDHFREIGARRIHSGFLVIHRGDVPWVRADARSLGKLENIAGPELRRVVEGQTWLARTDPSEEALLEARYTVPAGVHAQTDLILDKGWGARTIRLMSPAELSYNGQIDEFLLRLLALCREGQPPSAMVAELRATPRFEHMAELAPQIAGLVRELIGHGLLLPSELA
jgi:SAM-dependent methyltransferase